jgi:hypothetical protein
MDPVSLGLGLTPRGRLVLSHDADPPHLDSGLVERLLRAFERGPGHGLLLLGADEAGTSLPPVHSYWREFGARYVTALCVQEDSDAARQKLRVACPPGEDLERMALAAPPMKGAAKQAAAKRKARPKPKQAASTKRPKRPDATR